MIKRGSPAAAGESNDPNRPMVIRGHCKIQTVRALRKLLFNERAVEESMDAPRIAKPDVALAINQFRSRSRINVVGFSATPGRLALGIVNRFCRGRVDQDRIFWLNPDAVGSVYDLKGVFPEYRVGEWPVVRIATGIVHNPFA